MGWWNGFFNDADKKDIGALEPWFAENVVLRLGNNPPVAGRQAVVATFAAFFGAISAMRHAEERALADGDWACSTAIVTYTRADRTKVSLPTASLLHKDEIGKIDSLQIFIDIQPLFAAAA